MPKVLLTLLLVALLLPTVSLGQCNFAIKANSKEVCVNDVVNFSIIGNTSNISSASWNFGFKQITNNLKPCPNNSYFWVIIVRAKNKKTYLMSGEVYLLR